MALQGTLDTFALADVLRLLATTNKTGRLRVTGDRGSGSVWVDEGRVVGTELAVPGATDDDSAHTLFALLRFSAGSFTFESGAKTVRRGEPQDVEPLLDQAELLLAEWRSIEAVVPSLDAWLTLREELENDVVVDGPRWRVISAVGGGTTAGAVGEVLRAGEMETLRAVKELVELGLIEVGDRPVNAIAPAASPSPAQSARPSTVAPRSDRDPAPPSLAEMSSGLGSVQLAGEEESATDDAGASPITATSFAAPHLSSDDAVPSGGFSVADLRPAEPFGSALAPPPYPPAPSMQSANLEPSTLSSSTLPSTPPSLRPDETPSFDDVSADDAFDAPVNATVPAGGHGEPTLDDAAEIARQLANLSPRAAKAVAAAAKATTEEEREAALAAIEAEDDTVNRGLLLRFLGSVDS